MATKRKLNIGSGASSLPGYEAWDIKDGHSGYPLDVPDGACAEIYASHVLEHWGYRDTMKVLKDWFRALAPGGRLRVAVPDFAKIVEAYNNKTEGFNFDGYTVGGQVDDADLHRAIFNDDKLRRQLRAVGFVNVGPWVSEIGDCSGLPVSLNLQGFKPAPVPATAPQGPSLDPPKIDEACRAEAAQLPRPGVRTPRITAVWSCPRLGFMDAFNSVYVGLPPYGIKLLRGMGVYWGQQIECLMAKALESDIPEAILTLDYDAVWTPADLGELIRLFVLHPEADAICAHQWNRAAEKPLWHVNGRGVQSGNPVTAAELLAAGDLFAVDAAHFGLTLIRTSALQHMPHPWFDATPAPDGTWTMGKVDADIQFWHSFRTVGCRAFLAPRVVIGHLELAVRWPGQDLTLHWQHMYDYHDNGRPRSNVFGAAATTEK